MTLTPLDLIAITAIVLLALPVVKLVKHLCWALLNWISERVLLYTYATQITDEQFAAGVQPATELAKKIRPRSVVLSDTPERITRRKF